MNNNDKFSTKDLHLAAFLKLNGAVISKLERHVSEFRDRNPVFFVFEDKERCVYLENIFWTGEGDEVMINAKLYVDMVRDLRARTSSVNNTVQS